MSVNLPVQRPSSIAAANTFADQSKFPTGRAGNRAGSNSFSSPFRIAAETTSASALRPPVHSSAGISCQLSITPLLMAARTTLLFPRTFSGTLLEFQPVSQFPSSMVFWTCAGSRSSSCRKLRSLRIAFAAPCTPLLPFLPARKFPTRELRTPGSRNSGRPVPVPVEGAGEAAWTKAAWNEPREAKAPVKMMNVDVKARMFECCKVGRL
mmetsp:Transcript_25399/g.63936  ORF Transcript_25399/g.63936 Transcript_25399/m.63936 type:complete len:209 (-) Transcript_25399:557-1183(-)